MFRFVIGILLVIAFVSEVAPAQTPQTLVEGQRVRVAYRCRGTRDQVLECRKNLYTRVATGQLQTLDADTLRMRSQSSHVALAIPTASVSHLWVVEGTKGNFWAGAGIGILGGALIGGIIGSTQEFCIYSCSPATPIGVMIGVPAGFLLGGIVGSTIRSDRWRALPVDGLHVTLEPRPEAIGLAVSAAF